MPTGYIRHGFRSSESEREIYIYIYTYVCRGRESERGGGVFPQRWLTLYAPKSLVACPTQFDMLHNATLNSISSKWYKEKTQIDIVHKHCSPRVPSPSLTLGVTPLQEEDLCRRLPNLYTSLLNAKRVFPSVHRTFLCCIPALLARYRKSRWLLLPYALGRSEDGLYPFGPPTCRSKDAWQTSYYSA